MWTICTGGAGGSEKVSNCSSPLHARADMEGRGHEPALSLEQHEPPAGFSASSRVAESPQAELHAASSEQIEAFARGTPMPLRSSSLMRPTHKAQCADSDFTALEAAIHCSSRNSTPLGGRTPFSIAHINRSCSEWQQQWVQHSFADAQPQPQSSQGYRSPLSCPNQPPITRGDGSTPKEATR